MTDQVIALEDLKPDKRNARKHSEQNIGVIADSIKAVGPARSGVIDEEGNLLAGNGTAEAMALAGITRVRVIEPKPGEWAVVRMRGLTDEQKRQLAWLGGRRWLRNLPVALGAQGQAVGQLIAQFGVSRPGLDVVGVHQAGRRSALLAGPVVSLEDRRSPFALGVSGVGDGALVLFRAFVSGMVGAPAKLRRRLPVRVLRSALNAGKDSSARLFALPRPPRPFAALFRRGGGHRLGDGIGSGRLRPIALAHRLAQIRLPFWAVVSASHRAIARRLTDARSVSHVTRGKSEQNATLPTRQGDRLCTRSNGGVLAGGRTVLPAPVIQGGRPHLEAATALLTRCLNCCTRHNRTPELVIWKL